MSIKPLDLQTLFMKMPEVGKEQAHLKGSAAAQQAAAAQAQIKKELEQDQSVNELMEDQVTGSVKDDEGQNNEEESQNEHPQNDEEPKSSRSVYSDPDMGKHIDLSG